MWKTGRRIIKVSKKSENITAEKEKIHKIHGEREREIARKTEREKKNQEREE